MHRASVFSTSWPALIISCLFDNGHSDRCEVISHCSFGVCFSDDQWHWAFSYTYWPWSVCLFRYTVCRFWFLFSITWVDTLVYTIKQVCSSKLVPLRGPCVISPVYPDSMWVAVAIREDLLIKEKYQFHYFGSTGHFSLCQHIFLSYYFPLIPLYFVPLFLLLLKSAAQEIIGTSLELRKLLWKEKLYCWISI